MSNETVYQQLREASWKRRLTPAEETQLAEWLASHPADRADWELERSLNTGLRRLPDVPVSSNFTARLMQSLEMEERQNRRAHSRWSFVSPWSWVLRGALASVVVGVGLLTMHQVQVAQRNQMVRSVAAVSAVASMPTPEILEDFEAIHAMNPAPAADEELLALLQ